jgi:diaminohydroxyphosphoribosylaminopyrimidine deaminase / 5-amino-6-(5-phosphoribosylamino)uracil reductase
VKDLGQREVNELHLEAGSKLNGSFMREGLVDEMLVYLAPMVLGGGAGMVDLKGLLQIEKIPTRRDWQFVDCQRVGGDLRMRVESRR